MRFWKIICLLSLLVTEAKAQTVSGVVTNGEGDPLWGATLQSNVQGVSTDSLGFYTLNVNSNTTKITIQFLGYETIVRDVEVKSDTIVNWILSPVAESLEEIVVRADQDNLFSDFKPHLLDFIIEKELIICLVDAISDKYLIKADLQGNVISKFAVDKDFYEINRSCLGGILLIGRRMCFELMLVNNDDDFQDSTSIAMVPIDRKLYESLFVPCVLKQNETVIFKKVAVHNKRVTYYRYNEEKRRVPIYSLFDSESAQVSQSYFRDILIAYNHEVENAGEDAIDYGASRYNILRDGNWSGELMDLILENGSQQAVATYLALATKEVETGVVKIDSTTCILDWFNKEVLMLNDDGTEVERRDSLPKFANPEVHFSQDGRAILIDDNKKVYHIIIDGQNVNFVPSNHEYTRRHIIKRTILYQGKLYQLGRSALGGFKNEIFVQNV